MGDNQVRQTLQEQAEALEARLATWSTPGRPGHAGPSGARNRGDGGRVINCGSSLGRGCIVNTSACVDHDNLLEDFVHVSPGARLAGTVHIGQGTWIGIGATVINNRSVAAGCRIGAGAVVIRDITQKGTYVGIPARRL